MSSARMFLRVLVSAAVVAALVAIAVFMVLRAEPPAPPLVPVVNTEDTEELPPLDEIPMPFFSDESELQGAVIPRGTRHGVELFEVTFPEGTDTETLLPDRIYMVRVPERTDRMPLAVALLNSLTGDVDFYGYQYSSPMAERERTNARAERFADRFPGTFFASQTALAHDAQYGNTLKAFSEKNGVAFTSAISAPDAPLLQHGLYILVVNDEGGTELSIKRRATCGNGLVDPGEECDDGNTDDADECSKSCVWFPLPFGSMPKPLSICGNGNVEGSEQCDDGNTSITDGCSPACYWLSAPHPLPVTAVCGNGKLDGVEQCDDGNTKASDGCSAICITEGGWLCNARNVDSPEAPYTPQNPESLCMTCTDTDNGDDAQTKGSITLRYSFGFPTMHEEDQCNVDSVFEVGCGEDMVPTLTVMPCTGGTCNNGACVEAVCGNGKIEKAEQCDDGNTSGTDGCSANCQIVAAPVPVPTVTDSAFVRALADINPKDGTINDNEALLFTLNVIDATDKPFATVKQYDIDANGVVNDADVLRLLTVLPS